MVVTDPVFEGTGQKEGLQIWRVEKLALAPQRPQDYGTFFTGDSYLVLASFGSPKPFSWNIHFWLGAETSTDEQTVAAVKAVELDDLLGGAPVQYREVQAHESREFLALFPKGIRYLSGGVSSGLSKVDLDEFEKRLYHVKGKRDCRITQVPLSVDSLNLGDVFVLDLGKTIIIWRGPNSSITERNRAAEFARETRDNERSGRAQIRLLGYSPTGNDDWDTDAEFYSEIGAKPGAPIKETDGDDRAHERNISSEYKLYRIGVNDDDENWSQDGEQEEGEEITDSSGKLKVEEETARPLSPGSLDTKDCFILNLGASGVYVWVGKGCTKQEKEAAWSNAQAIKGQSKAGGGAGLGQQFISAQHLPAWTPVVRVTEGSEPAIFKAALNFPVDQVDPFATKTVGNNVAQIDESAHRIDIGAVQRKRHAPKPPAVGFMPDDGSGEKQVWRVEGFKLADVEPSAYGTFYGGDSYVVLYGQQGTQRAQAIVYFWQGNMSTSDEKAASAMMATHVDQQKYGGGALQIRVPMYKEPDHFVKIFGGSITVLMGGHASGFRNTNQTDSYDTDGVRLFQVRNHRVLQVPERAASLNSNDVFLLETPATSYVWQGKGASESEAQLARSKAEQLNLTNVESIGEGEEPDAFWSALGGRAEYASDATLKSAASGRLARLFQISNDKGYMRIEEIGSDFTQEDLIEDDVMLLDTGNEIYVWVGAGANEREKRDSLDMAKQYLQSDSTRSSSSSGSSDALTLVVQQGSEPLSFTGHFGVWQPNLWSRLDQSNLAEQLRQENSAADAGGGGGSPVSKPRAPAAPQPTAAAAPVQTVDQSLAKYSATYPVEVLRQSDGLPDGVDPANKERHLNDADFAAVFGISRDKYNATPKWRQLEMKKKAGLF